MSVRQPRKISGETPHQKLDIWEVREMSGRPIDETETDYEIAKTKPVMKKQNGHLESEMEFEELDGKSKAGRVIGIGCCLLQAAFSIEIIVLSLALNIIPKNVIIFIILIIALILGISFILVLPKKSRTSFMGLIFSVVFCVILCLASVYIIKTNNSNMSSVTGSADHYQYISTMHN